MAEKPTTGGLDTPLELRSRMLPNFGSDPDAFGRFAERFARYMGTANFLFYMTIFVVIWIAFNVIGLFGFQWDPYPFILLNLFFSTQASYAAPLILLAQNRQDDRDRVTIEQDRARDERNLADTEYLTREVAALRIALREVATRDYVRAELRSLLSDLLEAQDEMRTDDPAGSNRSEKAKDKIKEKRDKQRNPRTQQIPKIHPAHSSADQTEPDLSSVGTSPARHSGPPDQPES
ncbi:putative membrane protein [Arthrobacter bambusae]|nr:putative membrane protein [Arthrobacter bambusae]MDQ0233768.1 putative membrane protein [Arthrobacter bambusae]